MSIFKKTFDKLSGNKFADWLAKELFGQNEQPEKLADNPLYEARESPTPVVSAQADLPFTPSTPVVSSLEEKQPFVEFQKKKQQFNLYMNAYQEEQIAWKTSVESVSSILESQRSYADQLGLTKVKSCDSNLIKKVNQSAQLLETYLNNNNNKDAVIAVIEENKKANPERVPTYVNLLLNEAEKAYPNLAKTQSQPSNSRSV